MNTIQKKLPFPFSHFTALLLFPFLFSLFTLLLSCTSPTETPTGELSGVVNLEGMQDHSGIVVALYELAYLDTTITRINQEYPHIGVIINQHTEFDHRLQSPIKFTETLADGSFEIIKIPTGIYNLVAMKAGFGFKYLYEIEIVEGDNELSELVSSVILSGDEGSSFNSKLKTQNLKLENSESNNSSNFKLNRDSDLTLYPEHHISGNISEDVIVEPYHHLVIDSDAEFIPGTNFTIMPNAVVRINPAQDLIIHGNLTAQGEENNMFWVTSNDGFDLLLTTTYSSRDSLELYNSMKLSNSASIEDDLIDWGKWDYANTCLLNLVDNITMQEGVFRNGGCGYAVTNVDQSISNNIFCNEISNLNNAGIFYYFVNSGEIKNSFFINCYNGIMVKDFSNPNVYNNYCKNNEYGMQFYISNSQIHNNTINNCENGLRICGEASPHIELNSIVETSVGFNIGYNAYYPEATPEIHNNNLDCGFYYFVVVYASQLDINAQYNYYYTNDFDEINSKVYDKDDYIPQYQDMVGIVSFKPYFNQKIDGTGVQE